MKEKTMPKMRFFHAKFIQKSKKENKMKALQEKLKVVSLKEG
jgi:hypothetical protein